MATTSTTTLLAMIDSSPFWSSFLADLFAGLLILILASWLIPKLFRWREMPSVRLLDFKRRKDAFVFTSAGTEWETSLRLIIQNRGNKTLEKYYWEMYIENGLTVELPRIATQPGHATIASEAGEKFTRWYGYMVLPIFPLDDVDFPIEIKIKLQARRSVTIFYFFRTDYGQSPFWSWLAVHYGKLRFLKKLTVR